MATQIIGYNEPFPSRDAIVTVTIGGKTYKGFPEETLITWIEQSLLQRVQNTPFRLQSADVLTQIAASTIGTLGGDSVAGLYRVSVYREVTAVDPVSSGLDVTLGWQHNGKAMLRALSAFSGAPQAIDDSAGNVEVIEIDPGTPISYTLTYASAGAVAQFSATLTSELLQPIQ